MKNKEKYISGLIYIVYLTCVLGFVSNDFFFVLSDYLSYIIFVLLASIFFISRKKYSRKDIVFCVLFLILFLFSLFHSISGMGSYLNLINAFLIFLISGNLKFSDKTYKNLSLIGAVLFSIFFIKAFSSWRDFMQGTALMNPNSVAQALILCACTLYMGTSKFIKNKTVARLLQTGLLIATFAGAMMCNSRTAVLSIILLSAFIKINFLKKAILKVYKLTGILLVLIGVAIPFAYVDMYSNGIELDLPLISEKGFYTGREVIWKYGIDELNANDGYLLGLGTHHETAIGEISNFHNWYIGEIYYFGLAISFIYYAFMIYRLSKIDNNELKILALSVFIFGFFETSIQWEFSLILFILMMMFGGLKNTDRVVKNEK
jgi:hypothetical protein